MTKPEVGFTPVTVVVRPLVVESDTLLPPPSIDQATFWLVALAGAITAVRDCVPPCGMLADDGFTVTPVTGMAFTVTAQLPLLPSAVAVMVALPGATAVTRPVDDTVAKALPPDQVTVLFVASAGRTVAVSCWVAPGVRVAVGGATVTVATGII